jgi:TPR repeat protein
MLPLLFALTLAAGAAPAGQGPLVAQQVAERTETSAAARLALSKVSAKDWSISDSDELLKRIVDASSVESIHSLAAEGDVRAETMEGIGLLTGAQGFRHDEGAAAQDFEAAAKTGFAPAQVMLGFMYQFGYGALPQDENLAVSLYRKAADQADAGGQMCLADMYADGRGGLPKDRAKAVQLYRLSAGQGDKQAADRLAALGEKP